MQQDDRDDERQFVMYLDLSDVSDSQLNEIMRRFEELSDFNRLAVCAEVVSRLTGD